MTKSSGFKEDEKETFETNFLLNRILECLCYAARGVCFAINVSISTPGVNGKNKRRTLQKDEKTEMERKYKKCKNTENTKVNLII